MLRVACKDRLSNIVGHRSFQSDGSALEIRDEISLGDPD